MRYPRRIKVGWWLSCTDGEMRETLPLALYEQYKEDVSKLLAHGRKPQYSERYQCEYNQDDFIRGRFTIVYTAFIVKVPRFLAKHLTVNLSAKAEAMKKRAIAVLNSFNG